MRLVISRSPRLGCGAAIGRLSPLFRSIAASVPPRNALVGVNWIGVRGMGRLNRTYRNRRGASEILTFSCAGGPDPGRETPVGEIYLCWERLSRGARGRGVSARSYAARLLVHGLLHLRGFSHADARSAALMETAEARRLRAYLSGRDVERLFA
jgi:rRNA maturation RNase YbeY